MLHEGAIAGGRIAVARRVVNVSLPRRFGQLDGVRVLARAEVRQRRAVGAVETRTHASDAASLDGHAIPRRDDVTPSGREVEDPVEFQDPLASIAQEDR